MILANIDKDTVSILDKKANKLLLTRQSYIYFIAKYYKLADSFLRDEAFLERTKKRRKRNCIKINIKDNPYFQEIKEKYQIPLSIAIDILIRQINLKIIGEKIKEEK